MANTKKTTSTKNTKTTTKSKTKTVPAKKPTQKPAGTSRKPAEYKPATSKSQNTTHKTSTKAKNTKHGSEIIFGIIIVVLALVIAAGAIFYFCCGRNKNTISIDAGNDKSVAARYVEIADYKTSVLIPRDFKQLNEEGIKNTSFAMSEGIKAAYTNEDKSVVISLAQLDSELTNDEVKTYTNATKSVLEAAKSEDLESIFYESDGHNVGMIKFFNVNANKTYPYRALAIFSQDNKATLVNFECTEAARADWENVGDTIIKSIRFTEEEKK